MFLPSNKYFLETSLNRFAQNRVTDFLANSALFSSKKSVHFLFFFQFSEGLSAQIQNIRPAAAAASANLCCKSQLFVRFIWRKYPNKSKCGSCKFFMAQLICFLVSPLKMFTTVIQFQKFRKWF